MSSSAVSCAIPLTTSPDGYLRLTFDEFSKLRFRRKLAWEDDELKEELILEDVPAWRAGYCDWATDGIPAASVSWAWFATMDGRKWLAPGGVNSNVMLTTGKHYDLGPCRTDEMLRTWLANERWQATAAACTS